MTRAGAVVTVRALALLPEACRPVQDEGSMAELNARHEQVLGSVVEEFVHSAEPVGSQTLTRRRDLGVSPATVRNAMADLEELGYLDQPHTSAGRRPTDQGYRYYVDHLMAEGSVPAVERRRLRRQIVGGDCGDLDAVLDFASKALSAACLAWARWAMLVVSPAVARCFVTSPSAVFRRAESADTLRSSSSIRSITPWISDSAGLRASATS